MDDIRERVRNADGFPPQAVADRATLLGMIDNAPYSYLVRVVVHDPRGKEFAPTNTTVEFIVSGAINDALLNDVPNRELSGLSVTVESERLDR
jgi:hypothetical protein